jgi:hypothetical protein
MARKNASRSSSSSRVVTEVVDNTAEKLDREEVGYEVDDEHSIERVRKLTDLPVPEFQLIPFLSMVLSLKWMQIQMVWGILPLSYVEKRVVCRY